MSGLRPLYRYRLGRHGWAIEWRQWGIEWQCPSVWHLMRWYIFRRPVGWCRNGADDPLPWIVRVGPLLVYAINCGR